MTKLYLMTNTYKSGIPLRLHNEASLSKAVKMRVRKDRNFLIYPVKIKPLDAAKHKKPLAFVLQHNKAAGTAPQYLCGRHREGKPHYSATDIPRAYRNVNAAVQSSVLYSPHKFKHECTVRAVMSVGDSLSPASQIGEASPDRRVPADYAELMRGEVASDRTDLSALDRELFKRASRILEPKFTGMPGTTRPRRKSKGVKS